MKNNRPAEIRQEIAQLKVELDTLQLEGEPLIVELADRLYKEVEAQGYNPGICICIWKHEGYEVSIDVNDKSINEFKEVDNGRITGPT